MGVGGLVGVTGGQEAGVAKRNNVLARIVSLFTAAAPAAAAAAASQNSDQHQSGHE